MPATGCCPCLPSLARGLEEVFVFDSKGENRNGAVEAIESDSTRVRVGVRSIDVVGESKMN